MEPVYALILCLDCEALTGVRSVRFVTRNGTCSTCGSNSIMRGPDDKRFGPAIPSDVSPSFEAFVAMNPNPSPEI